MVHGDITQHHVDAMAARKVREPKYFDRFRCVGADCEDTCCIGWGVPIDQETYTKYQQLPDRTIAGKPLSGLVEINPAGTPGDYARFRMSDGKCPALHENLCAIQQALGEPYIPDLCSKYPRALNDVGGVVERSLQLSCPEAARLALCDPDAMVFEERVEESLPHRPGSFNWVASGSGDQLCQVRTLLIEWIQERSIPLWQRIVSLGFAIDRLAGVDVASAAIVLEENLRAARQPSFRAAFATQQADTVFKLETVLDLVVGRIGSDYTTPRFLDCYREFMQGLEWTPEKTMEELAARYERASQSFGQPLIDRHPQLLENYLINYIFGTVFPYRSRLPDRKFAIDSSGESLRHSFVLLVVHYAIIRVVLGGMAAWHRDHLSIQHAVKLVQSYSKAFLHSTAFEAAATEYLDKNFGDSARKVAALVMD